MIVFLFSLFLISIFRCKFANLHNDYLSIKQSTSIKGIFAIIILFSHSLGYIDIYISNSNFDKLYVYIISQIGQLMVALFFFYSGFGIFESYKNKPDYQKVFFKNRILKTLIRFDLAVIIYMILSFVLGNKYPLLNYFFCWLGWESIGNSNWFIFVTLLLYLATFIIFKINKSTAINNKNQSFVILLVAFSCLAMLLLFMVGKQTYWYDTILCFAFGSLYSLFKKKIDMLFNNSSVFHIMSIIASFLIFAFLFVINRLLDDVVTYNLLACAFCLFIVIFITKVKIENKILIFLGKYSFEIYILQRIPMMIFSKFNINSNKYLFMVLTITSTIVISILFQKATNYLIDYIYKKKKA